MEIIGVIGTALTLIVGTIAAYYAYKQNRITMLGKPAIGDIQVRKHETFIALSFNLLPGDMTVTINKLRIKGRKIAPPNVPSGVSVEYQKHLWLPPDEESWADELPLDIRLRPDSSPSTVCVSVSSSKSDKLLIKCATTTRFLPIEYKARL